MKIEEIAREYADEITDSNLPDSKYDTIYKMNFNRMLSLLTWIFNKYRIVDRCELEAIKIFYTKENLYDSDLLDDYVDGLIEGVNRIISIIEYEDN